MKIGIITHQLGYNYGGILQNYALQTVLKRMGHQPITLNPDPHISFNFRKWILALPKKIAYKYYLKLPRIHLFEEFSANKIRRTIMQNLQPFIDKHIDYINVVDFAKLENDGYEALIAGSDQIWRPPYVHPIEKGFFFFAENWKNIIRLSYAASFGTNEWEYTPEQEANCKRLIQMFDGVSVREESGIYLCQKYFSVKAVHVLDPTMLISKDDYMKLVCESNVPNSSGNLLNYILDETPDKLKLQNKLILEKGLTPFRVNGKPEGGYPMNERIQPPIESWLKGFYDAKFVLTDSFHACVFSIIFNKPFIAYANKQRGYARFQSLLKMFGLENRLIYKIEDYDRITDDIDWSRVNKVMRQKQIDAIQFLNDSLSIKKSN